MQTQSSPDPRLQPAQVPGRIISLRIREQAFTRGRAVISTIRPASMPPASTPRHQGDPLTHPGRPRRLTS
jgi:hypothetical protein